MKAGPVTLRIFCDNKVEALWFKQLSPLLKSASVQRLEARGANPAIIDDLIAYDRPDIVLMAGGKPALVVEKTREVPTGHNVGQRIARLARAVEMGVPTIKFFPFDARKHGDYSSMCNLNIRLLAAFNKMRSIHNVPILAVNWPADGHGELVDDGSEDERMRMIVDDYLRGGLDPSCSEIRKQLVLMENSYKERLARYPKYGAPPGESVCFMSTRRLVAEVFGAIHGHARHAFEERPKSLVYTMKMTPGKCRREDPYTGTQFVYDYIWCRSGKTPEEKHTNLVLRFPLITRKVWTNANPNDPQRKSCNWYLTATGLWFKDDMDILR
jgi:hypothetical protein